MRDGGGYAIAPQRFGHRDKTRRELFGDAIRDGKETFGPYPERACAGQQVVQAE